MSAQKIKKASYKELMAELQQVLDAMQGAQSDIDMAMQNYERGQTLIKELQQYLAQAESKVTRYQIDHNRSSASA